MGPIGKPQYKKKRKSRDNVTRGGPPALASESLDRSLVLQLKRLGNLKNKCNAMRFWEGDPID